jgi:hypothetical protein
MSVSQNSALASLTETYTDSEEEHEDHQRSRENEEMEESESPSSSRDSLKNPAPIIQQEPAKAEQKKSLRLVSYNDFEDNPISDDEDKDEENKGTVEVKLKTNEEILEKLLIDPNDKFAKYRQKYGFTLPPEAKGQPRPELQEKISSMVEKMKVNNKLDMNKIIQERKEFRNPSIYEKLIQFCSINELGTNFPAEIYDVSYYGKDSYYEELARVQKVEMDKLEKVKKESAKNEAIAKANKLVEDEPKKRKSKWDQPALSSMSGSIANVTNITKTHKTTIINAFGSLSKKPKL